MFHSKQALFKRVILLSLLLVFISGCASLNKAECISANWSDLGVENALSGKRSNYIAEHTQACAKHTITPDFIAYKKGWEVGVVKFCTAQSGWDYGTKGNYYHNTCDAKSEQLFLPAYKLGRKLSKKQGDLERSKSETRDLFKALVNDKLSHDQRSSIMSERFSLSFEQQRIEFEILQIEREASSKGLL